MPLQTNLNVSPYHDDYDELKNYYQMLFRPGYPVQARELTQMQTMQQYQISSLAERFMKDGDNIVPGEYGLSVPVTYVRTASITQGSTPSEYVGYIFSGVTSGVKAEILRGEPATETDDITFYIQYISSGNTSEYLTFIEGETLTTNHPSFYTATVGIDGTSKPIDTKPMGSGTLFNVTAGTFFVDGFMVRNDPQEIVVSKYTTRPNALIGFKVDESIVNSSEDPTLLDNATGSSNFAAPGADRLKIELKLHVMGLNDTLPNFIRLCTVIQGNVQGTPGDTIKWDWLYDILAKRTYEESGDYIITQFTPTIMAYANTLGKENGVPLEDSGLQPLDRKGLFNAGADGKFPPVPGSGSTERIDNIESNDYYVLEVEPGKAYVQGYRVEYTSSVYLYGKRARERGYRANTTTTMTQGYNFAVTHSYGTPDVQNISGAANAQGLQQLTLYRNFADGFVGEATRTTSDLEPINYGNEPWTTYHIVCAESIEGVDDPAYTTVYKKGNSAVVNGTVDLVRGSTYGGKTVLISTKVNPVPTGVLTPRYFTPQDQVDDQNGRLGYNSTSNLGITQSNFFNQIPTVDVSNGSIDWVVGNLVVGDVSRATGVVEKGTVKTDTGVTNLIVSNVRGQFRNGETITQGTGATQKVSRVMVPGETFGFEFFTGAGGVVGGSTDLSGETYIDVTTLGSTIRLAVTTDFTATASRISLTDTGREKLLNFPFPQGSILAVERINLDVTTEGGALGYALLLPGALTNTLTRTKSVFADLAGFDKFAADISSETTSDSEVVQVASNALFTGQINNTYIECDNFSGDPSKELGFGDVVTFVDDAGAPISKMVYFATAPVGRSDARAKARIYFTTTLQAGVTGKTVQRIRVKPKGKTTQSLIFQLPQAACYSLQTNQTATAIDYEVYQEYIVNISETTGGNAGEVTLTLVGDATEGSETIRQFLDDPNQISISAIKNLSDSLDTANITGRFLSIDQNYDSNNYRRGILLQDNDTKITMHLSYTDIPACTVKVMIPIKVRNAVARKKVFRDNVTITIPQAEASKEIVPLGITDLTNVYSVKNADGDEIRQNYTIDDGQRDNAYTLSRLILNADAPPADSDITVVVSYYTHEGTGDFFSVDSYPVDYYLVSNYFPQTMQIEGSAFTSKIGIQLRNCLDFRPVMNTLTDGTQSEPSKLALTTDALCTQGTVDGSRSSDINYKGAVNGGNAVVPSFPVPQSRFECNIEYYMPKIDTLFLTNQGELKLVEGVPADNPQPNPDLATGIRLYDFFIPPYTFKTMEIQPKKYNYKRYRMQDIAKIERRVDRVEELVTLSILEQSALNMSVRDAVTGLDRFKNGIVVDNFRGHDKGAVGSSQYRNSIDGRYTYLRAPIYVDQSTLEEAAITKAERDAENYAKSKDGIATLNYTDAQLVFQPFATRTINLQHYQVFCYDGDMVLDPPIDTFYDVTTLPDVVIEDNTLHDAMVNLTEFMAFAGIGTSWGEWEDTGNTSTVVNTITESSGGSRVFLNTLPFTGFMNRSGPAHITRTDRFLQTGATTISIENTTTSTEQSRVQTQSILDVQSGQVVNTSYGDRISDISLSRTMRSIPVAFRSTRLKPNTRYYAFFDKIPVDEYVSPDAPTPGSEFPDGLSRADTEAGLAQKGFGEHIISDDLGNVSGIFFIPNGRAPVAGTTYRGMEEMQLQTTGPTRSFNTGTKTFRLTSNPANPVDIALLEGYAQADFTSAGVIADKQETIVATRMSEFNRTQVISDTETRTEVETVQTGLDISIGESTVVTETRRVRNPLVDPISQSFHVDKGFTDGVFVTEVEVYFSTKDADLPVEAYMVTTDGFVVTNEVLPHGKISKMPDSKLRTQVTLPTGTNSVELPSGATITGNTSGATGIIKSAMVFNSPTANATTNVDNTIYNVLLNNYVNDFVADESFTVTTDNATLSSTTFQIVSDTYSVDRIEVTNFGSGYSQPDTTTVGEVATTVSISAPDLIGGINATATCKVSRPDMPGSGTSTYDGLVYQITVTNRGTGYTSTPSVTINGDGSGATAVARVQDAQSAVEMGVATSDDATAGTRFRFPAPVYLLPDTWYGFTCRSPETKQYNMYISKLGENQLGTTDRVIEQPNLGSMFASQDGGLWTEDQTKDVKFILRRASFETGSLGRVTLRNEPLLLKALTDDPIEVNSNPLANADDVSFGTNPNIVKVTMAHHGLIPGDFVVLDGIVGTGTPSSIGGITPAQLNTLHQVVDIGMDVFTIKVAGTGATGSLTGGGENVRSTYNLPYELTNVNTGAQVYPSSTFRSTVRTTQAEAMSGFNSNLAYTLDTPVAIDLLDSYYFTGPKQIPSPQNQVKHNNVFQMNGRRGYELVVNMNTSNDAVSPVLDIVRTNATVVRNLINNPQPTDDIYGPQVTTITLNDVDVSAVSLTTGNTLSFTNDSVERKGIIQEYNATTKRVVIKGQFANLMKKASTINDTALAAVGAASVESSDGVLYKPETDPNGSVYAKWLSRLFEFENPCDGIELKLSTIFYGNVVDNQLISNSVKAYYRPRNIGFDSETDGNNWIPFNETGLPNNVNQIVPRSTGDMDPRRLKAGDWQALTWSIQDIPKFDAVAVKIVLTADNPAESPIIDDLQMVCTE